MVRKTEDPAVLMEALTQMIQGLQDQIKAADQEWNALREALKLKELKNAAKSLEQHVVALPEGHDKRVALKLFRK